MSGQVIELDSVSQRGDFVPVREVRLAIPRGSRHGCRGPSGAGKLTMRWTCRANA